MPRLYARLPGRGSREIPTTHGMFRVFLLYIHQETERMPIGGGLNCRVRLGSIRPRSSPWRELRRGHLPHTLYFRGHRDRKVGRLLRKRASCQRWTPNEFGEPSSLAVRLQFPVLEPRPTRSCLEKTEETISEKLQHCLVKRRLDFRV